jgi:hypothetical protein
MKRTITLASNYVSFKKLFGITTRKYRYRNIRKACKMEGKH